MLPIDPVPQYLLMLLCSLYDMFTSGWKLILVWSSNLFLYNVNLYGFFLDVPPILFLSEQQRQVFTWFWSFCCSRVQWLREEIQHGWAYLVCSYPWSRMGYFHASRCEVYEGLLSCIWSHICCIDNNFRGAFYLCLALQLHIELLVWY